MRKRLTSKKMILAIALLFVGLISSFYIWGNKEKPSYKLAGEVQAREFQSASRFGGRVQQVLVQEGDVVKPGQPLVVFDNTDLQAKIADAKASLAQAIAQEQLLSQGADVGQVRQAGAGVQQAQQRLKLVSEGARPEEISQAQSKVQAAKAQAATAQQTLKNAKTMLDEGIISQQKYEDLQQAADVAQSNLKAAQAGLSMLQTGGRTEERKIAKAQLSAAQAQYQQLLRGAKPQEVSIASANVLKARANLSALEAQLKEVRMTAPFEGYVSLVGVAPGELVAPGHPVITLIDYSHLWTDVYMPESKLLKLSPHPGEPVKVQTRSDDKSQFSGKISLINPKSEFIPNSGGDSSTEENTFRIKVTLGKQALNNNHSLYPGMKVDVLFEQ